MTLIAEVLLLVVHDVAIDALEFVLVVRRYMWIVRLHCRRFFNKAFQSMTARTGLKRWFFGILAVRTMAGLALHACGHMAFSKILSWGSTGCCCKKNEEAGKKKFFHISGSLSQ